MDSYALIQVFAKYGFIIVVTLSVLAFLYRMVSDILQVHLTRRKYFQVQRDIFEPALGSSIEGSSGADAGQTNLDKGRTGLPGSRGQPSSPYLLSLYNSQIEKYQADTQQRASYSFFFALVAMSAGLGFIAWAAEVVLTGDSTEHTIAATLVSGVGAALSGFITKTFTDLHKVSLGQLNRYFRQPVLNEHVMTVERLADQLDGPAKQSAYIRLIDKILSLMADANLSESSKAVSPSPDVSGGNEDKTKPAPGT